MLFFFFYRIGIEEKFRPFYSNQLEDYVEEDVKSLKVGDIPAALKQIPYQS